MKKMAVALLIVTLIGTPVFAQSFNIDVGPIGTAPSSSYAAAGLPGVWNSIPLEHVTPFTTGPHPSDYMLVDLDGNPTNVGCHNFGGTDVIVANNPSLTGDDATMMNDYLVTYTPNLESCIYINGLEPGTYEVLTYAWMPSDSGILQRVRFDFDAVNIPLVGGNWPGQHEEGVTYSRHIVEVTSSGIMTFMGLHVGIAPGGNVAVGAALNGFQIRPLPPLMLGDLNCDGDIDGSDVDDFVLALIDPDGYEAANPTCDVNTADMNGDTRVNVSDIRDFVETLLSS
ncbi:MAG: hypothetical protein MI923_07275 [Phycisphaerales bacterium]|nr:hypothetical protein [Phycisphaerales bacterium]